ncbi:MBOAT family O-acyltransferase [uncultured Gemmiger sp.]|uniref:MBOAT family O-acyltransferase n=1 Tax=uncultured Gemmiger sp. TaxID=1623490 RepID=UPI0025DC2D76|nr:MBOAT family O-acyltransferase [uncultured Gemmiger sp.]
MESQGLVFNSVVFLFGFLPVALAVYYLVPGHLKNLVLLLESVIFYCWAGVEYLPLITVLIVINYLFGLILPRVKHRAGRIFCLVLPILCSAAALVFFKYTNFLIDTVNQITSAGLAQLSFLDVLPLGISYYVFKVISYVADVYTGKTEAERNPITFAAYVLFFPQLLVGPIVKYRDMAPALHATRHRCHAAQMEAGAEMFVFGLAKKVILADSIGALWSDLLSEEIGLANVSTPLAWLGIAAYSLQLYFDFAGYSEMSNGLSKLMGFDCPANFDLPYISSSITEFWRRWHISLSSWFRDYIYIPLGGNRRGLPRQLFNMLVVWALTGIWHGASWNFICWGLYYFVLLTIEKIFLLKYLKKGRVWPHIYTLFFIVLGWGIFTANVAGAELPLLMSRLFIPSGGISPVYYLRNYGVLLILGVLFSTALPGMFWQWAKKHAVLRTVLVGCVMVLSVAFVVASTNNSPLYAGF